MAQSVIVTFADTAMIERGTEVIKKLHAEGSIKLYAAAVVARDLSGKLSIKEIADEGHGVTATSALIGGLAGLPLGPLAITIGAAAGALIGTSAERLNKGDEDEFAQKISRELTPGKAVVVAEIAEDDLSALELLMKPIGGTLVRK